MFSILTCQVFTFTIYHFYYIAFVPSCFNTYSQDVLNRHVKSNIMIYSNWARLFICSSSSVPSTRPQDAENTINTAPRSEGIVSNFRSFSASNHHTKPGWIAAKPNQGSGVSSLARAAVTLGRQSRLLRNSSKVFQSPMTLNMGHTA